MQSDASSHRRGAIQALDMYFLYFVLRLIEGKALLNLTHLG